MKKIAILTAGGIAPCLSSAVAALIKEYSVFSSDVEIICYRDGYKGLLLGESYPVTHGVIENADSLYKFGGSPIGNSRVKLTNAENCVKRGLVKPGQDPLQVAADQLVKDQIDVLHVIGGDDTNTTAADLARYLRENDYGLQVIGLPKTIDNDIFPVTRSLGANTAAEETANFFDRIVTEVTANPKTLIVHEVMGRKCGWLTAAAAVSYDRKWQERLFVNMLGLTQKKFEIHGVYIPEMTVNLSKETVRLKSVMESVGCVNIFVSEGACVDQIVSEMQAAGEKIERDAFGHVKLDTINPGQWFASHFARDIGAEKILVQKSGYFARSAPSNIQDITLINDSARMAVKCAFSDQSGVIGLDEENGGHMACIDFERIRGAKPFVYTQSVEFMDFLKKIGQI